MPVTCRHSSWFWASWAFWVILIGQRSTASLHTHKTEAKEPGMLKSYCYVHFGCIWRWQSDQWPACMFVTTPVACAIKQQSGRNYLSSMCTYTRLLLLCFQLAIVLGTVQCLDGPSAATLDVVPQRQLLSRFSWASPSSGWDDDEDEKVTGTTYRGHCNLMGPMSPPCVSVGVSAQCTRRSLR